MSNRHRFLVGIAFAAILSADLTAQSIYGTLTGIVSDPSQAVVAGAEITLHDQQSGSQRETVTNSDGYYTFSSVPPRGYELTVLAKGFETHKQTGIALGGGDKLNYNVSLRVGNTNNVIEVSGTVDVVVPVDSGENSNRLTTGTSNAANYNGQTIGINGNSNGGNQSPLNAAYSYNGLPGNSLDITPDGAHPTSNLAPNQYINPNCFSFPAQIKNFAVTERKKLQLRMNGYNFLNHPLWSFNGSNLNLGFAGATGILNTPLFGTVTTKQGHRIVQLVATFTF